MWKQSPAAAVVFSEMQPLGQISADSTFMAELGSAEHFRYRVSQDAQAAQSELSPLELCKTPFIYACISNMSKTDLHPCDQR